MLYAAKSHIGLVRNMNQDSYVVVPNLPSGHFYLVADGMGGPSAGDIASQMAVEYIRTYMEKHANGALEMDIRDLLREAVFYANSAVFQCAQDNPDYHGMGTTIVGVFVNDKDEAHFVHVGDSRAYRLSQSTLEQITKDHSLVAELVRRGQLTEDEAKTHPQRNIVTRSLGTESQSRPDLEMRKLEPNDVILLCSDGLTNYVADDELAQFLEEARSCLSQDSLHAVVEDMIELALARGGHDNVTAVLVVHREERDLV